MINSLVRNIRLAISGKQLNKYLPSSTGRVRFRHGAKLTHRPGFFTGTVS